MYWSYWKCKSYLWLCNLAFFKRDIICASLCCRSASSPRPLKSTLKLAVMESTIRTLKGSSAIFAANGMRRSVNQEHMKMLIIISNSMLTARTCSWSWKQESATCTLAQFFLQYLLDVHACMPWPQQSVDKTVFSTTLCGGISKGLEHTYQHWPRNTQNPSSTLLMALNKKQIDFCTPFYAEAMTGFSPAFYPGMWRYSNAF